MLRILYLLIAWAATVIAAVALAARFVPVVNHAVLIVAALAPYLTVGAAALSTAALLLARLWWAAGLAAALLVVAVSVQLPLFIASSKAPADAVAVRVLSVNLQMGSADPESLVAIARERADVLVVQELTPQTADAVAAIESDLPHRAVDARPSAAGVGIWSRYPIRLYSRDPGYELGVLTASLQVPGVSKDVLVVVAHVVGPWPQPIGGWRNEMAALPKTLAGLAKTAGDGAVIVAGDLNATPDMLPFRRLLSHGFRGAAEQSGAGLAGTYPAEGSTPALIQIDHILTRNAAATDVQTVRVPGTDHLGVAATIHLRRSATTG
jgi:endonuclease/exonuclease/phosphatase (EEP) superfamily protein YafD